MNQEQIEFIAGKCHEANQHYCAGIGDDSQPDWADAPDWQRKSAIAGVEFAIANDFPEPAVMHQNWAEHKFNEGWRYGPDKDAELKTHPCLVPFGDLPPRQQAKDKLFQATAKFWFKKCSEAEWFDLPALPSVLGGPIDPGSVTAPTGRPIEENFLFNAAGPRAMLSLSIALVGRLTEDVETDPNLERSAMVLYSFFSEHEDAPVPSGFTELRLRRCLAPTGLDPDNPRDLLALELFRHAVRGMNAIAEAEMQRVLQEQEAAQLAANARPHPDDLTMAVDDGRGEISDLGRALLSQTETPKDA